MLNLLKLFLLRRLPIRVAERLGKYMIVSIEEEYTVEGGIITFKLEDFAKYSRRNHVRPK